ncbi:MAG: hypothetical protein AAF915_13090 [Cyanobacteria bacterium P01_D01_bin.50]
MRKVASRVPIKSKEEGRAEVPKLAGIEMGGVSYTFERWGIEPIFRG